MVGIYNSSHMVITQVPLRGADQPSDYCSAPEITYRGPQPDFQQVSTLTSGFVHAVTAGRFE